MTDFLYRLAARALGQLPTVEPVHGSFFAAPTADPGLELEQSLEVVAPSRSASPSPLAVGRQVRESAAPRDDRMASSGLGRAAVDARPSGVEVNPEPVPVAGESAVGSRAGPRVETDSAVTANVVTPILPTVEPTDASRPTPTATQTESSVARATTPVISRDDAPRRTPQATQAMSLSQAAGPPRATDQRATARSSSPRSSAESRPPLEVHAERVAQSARAEPPQASDGSAAVSSPPRLVRRAAAPAPDVEVKVELVERQPEHAAPQLPTTDRWSGATEVAGTLDPSIAHTRPQPPYRMPLTEHVDEQVSARASQRDGLEQHNPPTVAAHPDQSLPATPPSRVEDLNAEQRPRSWTTPSSPAWSVRQSRRPEPQPAPTVHVTIGRIEVRATPPAPALPAPRQESRPAPALSLNEYLRRRDEGHRA